MSISKYNRVIGALSTSIIMFSSFATFAWGADGEAEEQANINLAVASNFYGTPPSNSAITDIIGAFEELHPTYTVTVVDNGATFVLLCFQLSTQGFGFCRVVGIVGTESGRTVQFFLVAVQIDNVPERGAGSAV